MIVKSNGTMAKCPSDSKEWWNIGTVAQFHSVRKMWWNNTVAYCLSDSKEWWHSVTLTSPVLHDFIFSEIPKLRATILN